MPRRMRDTQAGMFHVYTHCVWAAEALFRDDADRMAFLRELARACRKVGWTCIGYCLMRSHYHLVLDVDEDALPRGMHCLNFRYACTFNARYAMKGHVFGARYDSPRIDDRDQLLTVYKYVMRNPVRAGLCLTPQEWPWSSYASAVTLADPISFVDATAVLECFGDEHGETPVVGLRRFVEEI